MKIILLILINCIVLSASCSIIRLEKKHTGIDPKLKMYVDTFIDNSNGYVQQHDLDDITMGFHTYPDSSIIGTCWYIFGGNEIDINIKWFNNIYVSEIEKEAVIHHELGHCVLFRPHTNPPDSEGFLSWLENFAFEIGIYTPRGYLPDGCPISIMHPHVLSSKCLYRHMLYYKLELYHNSKIIKKTHDKYNIFRPEPQHVRMKKCTEPKIINKTKVWSKRDKTALESAKKTCKNRYMGCLKTFTKKAAYTYSVICS